MNELSAESDTPLPAAAQVTFDLNAMLADHARWVDTDGKEGKRANFRGYDLSGVDLSGYNLTEANFRSANLTDANFGGANLHAADMAEAILDGADISHAMLSGVSLARAQLHRVNAAGADLTTANLTAAIAENINLTNAKLSGAILRDTNFRHADFTHALLRDANMRGATLVEANLSSADLSSADCRDVNFDRTNFAGAVLAQTNFRDAKLGGVDLHAADFSLALDVATEFHELSLQSERTKLQEEQVKLAAWRSDLEDRERAILKEKKNIQAALDEVQGKQEEHAGQALRLGKFARGFRLRFFVWLLFMLIIIVLTALAATQVDNLQTGRLAGIIGSAAFVLLLAFMSMLRSAQIARILKKMAPPATEETVEKTADAMPVLSSDKIPEEAAVPKKRGFGFGKKD